MNLTTMILLLLPINTLTTALFVYYILLQIDMELLQIEEETNLELIKLLNIKLDLEEIEK